MPTWLRSGQRASRVLFARGMILIASFLCAEFANVGMVRGRPMLADATQAGTAQGKTAKTSATLESFGRDSPSCREWSDGCAVCAKQTDKTFACSLPGIACQPRAVACQANPSSASQPNRAGQAK